MAMAVAVAVAVAVAAAAAAAHPPSVLAIPNDYGEASMILLEVVAAVRENIAEPWPEYCRAVAVPTHTRIEQYDAPVVSRHHACREVEPAIHYHQALLSCFEVEVDPVCRELHRLGVSFRFVSLGLMPVAPS